MRLRSVVCSSHTGANPGEEMSQRQVLSGPRRWPWERKWQHPRRNVLGAFPNNVSWLYGNLFPNARDSCMNILTPHTDLCTLLAKAENSSSKLCELRGSWRCKLKSLTMTIPWPHHLVQVLPGNQPLGQGFSCISPFNLQTC